RLELSPLNRGIGVQWGAGRIHDAGNRRRRGLLPLLVVDMGHARVGAGNVPDHLTQVVMVKFAGGTALPGPITFVTFLIFPPEFGVVFLLFHKVSRRHRSTNETPFRPDLDATP